MLAHEIRQSFIDFFRERGHTQNPSSSLVPADDPTLLFTNAGMVQFKRVFQGLERRDDKRAVTVQKCVRAGGKHNDLEQVGHTTRHHTFFEMLGNFSFGDYFKRDAIAYGWEWITSDKYLGIHPDRLYVTVHHSDDEAAKLWHEVTGIAKSRIFKLGDKDNFWQMGDTGPCGPCSEIFVDIRDDVPRDAKKPSGLDPITDQAIFEELGEEGQLLEIWNLVFMQFDQAADGTRTPLPAPSVDTGAGLERIAAVLQGVDSNFHTDLFLPVIEETAKVLGKPYDRGPGGAPYRVLADHARAVAFLLADGVYPSNEGRGYVLRRILRRAVRHAYLLGRLEPTLTHLTESVIDGMGDVYPELRDKAAHILTVTAAEEERFLETIEDGLGRMDEITVGDPGTIGGEEAFKLYDTFGFPLDLTQLIAAERGWSVDVAGFEAALSKQQARSRAARNQAGGAGAAAGKRQGATGAWKTVAGGKEQRFVGYDVIAADTEILKYREHDDRVEMVLEENPFYAESGGQVSDEGLVKAEGWVMPVDGVHKEEGEQVVSGVPEGGFGVARVLAEVDEARRRDIERNHSATHLVHAALRDVLGTHVRQAGSVVSPKRLRFDFAHHQPMTDTELKRVEEQVNQAIWDNVNVQTHERTYKEALELGAMALFGEKYGDVVRVVDMPGVSVELCGGTHVRSTGQIGLFHFTGESGVAAGVRRIEAVTGPGAYGLMRRLEAQIDEVAASLNTNPEHLEKKIEGLLDEKRRLEGQVEDLLKRGGGSDVGEKQTMAGGVNLVIGESPVDDRAQVGMLMDTFREQNKNSISVLFTGGDRPGVHVAVTDDLVQKGIRAGDLVKRIAEVGGGKGGGRPHFASAGAGDPARLAEARKETPKIVAQALAGAAG